MRRWLLAGLIFALPACAEPVSLYGTIGGKPVFVDLNRNGDTISGWYYYLKIGKQIRLDGKLDMHGAFDIEEHDAATNNRTGVLSGRITGGHWNGSWKGPSGKSLLEVRLDPLKGSLAQSDGHYRCIAKRNDRDFGLRMTHSLDLTLAGGHVKGLKLERSTRGDDGDEQSCALSLRDLKPISAAVGVTLRARDDDRNAGQHCSLRILPAGDYLILRPGQASQAGDDCRGAGDATKFCSPRAFWADLVVNRKTQSCKSVE